MKRARFYLDSWQLQLAYDELKKVEGMNWADNRFYYQEWLLMRCQIQFRSDCGNHSYILQTLLDALPSRFMMGPMTLLLMFCILVI